VGLGYDLQLGSNCFLTSNVDLYAQYLDDDWTAALTIGVGVTWH
jgi:hypothetical protein